MATSRSRFSLFNFCIVAFNIMGQKWDKNDRLTYLELYFDDPIGIWVLEFS